MKKLQMFLALTALVTFSACSGDSSPMASNSEVETEATVSLRVLVADEDGHPVQGVTVWARNTDNAKVTNEAGEAVLQFPASADDQIIEIHVEAGYREEVRKYDPPITDYASVYIVLKD